MSTENSRKSGSVASHCYTPYEGERFIVDDRCGCVAVRDQSLIDPEYPGLHGDEDDCVQFWMKDRRKVQCECCQHVSMEYIADDHVDEAKALAEKLNATCV